MPSKSFFLQIFVGFSQVERKVSKPLDEWRDAWREWNVATLQLRCDIWRERAGYRACILCCSALALSNVRSSLPVARFGYWDEEHKAFCNVHRPSFRICWRIQPTACLFSNSSGAPSVTNPKLTHPGLLLIQGKASTKTQTPFHIVNPRNVNKAKALNIEWFFSDGL